MRRQPDGEGAVEEKLGSEEVVSEVSKRHTLVEDDDSGFLVGIDETAMVREHSGSFVEKEGSRSSVVMTDGGGEEVSQDSIGL